MALLVVTELTAKMVPMEQLVPRVLLVLTAQMALLVVTELTAKMVPMVPLVPPVPMRRCRLR
jgi:hypothetical protein